MLPRLIFSRCGTNNLLLIFPSWQNIVTLPCDTEIVLPGLVGALVLRVASRASCWGSNPSLIAQSLSVLRKCA